MSIYKSKCRKVSSFDFRIKQDIGSRVLSLSIANVTGMDRFKTPVSFIFEIRTVSAEVGVEFTMHIHSNLSKNCISTLLNITYDNNLLDQYLMVVFNICVAQ